MVETGEIPLHVGNHPSTHFDIAMLLLKQCCITQTKIEVHVDQMGNGTKAGVDKMGVDEMGIDEMAQKWVQTKWEQTKWDITQQTNLQHVKV